MVEPADSGQLQDIIAAIGTPLSTAGTDGPAVGSDPQGRVFLALRSSGDSLTAGSTVDRKHAASTEEVHRFFQERSSGLSFDQAAKLNNDLKQRISVLRPSSLIGRILQSILPWKRDDYTARRQLQALQSDVEQRVEEEAISDRLHERCDAAAQIAGSLSKPSPLGIEPNKARILGRWLANLEKNLNAIKEKYQIAPELAGELETALEQLEQSIAQLEQAKVTYTLRACQKASSSRKAFMEKLDTGIDAEGVARMRSEMEAQRRELTALKDYAPMNGAIDQAIGEIDYALGIILKHSKDDEGIPQAVGKSLMTEVSDACVKAANASEKFRSALPQGRNPEQLTSDSVGLTAAKENLQELRAKHAANPQMADTIDRTIQEINYSLSIISQYSTPEGNGIPPDTGRRIYNHILELAATQPYEQMRPEVTRSERERLLERFTNLTQLAKLYVLNLSEILTTAGNQASQADVDALMTRSESSTTPLTYRGAQLRVPTEDWVNNLGDRLCHYVGTECVADPIELIDDWKQGEPSKLSPFKEQVIRNELDEVISHVEQGTGRSLTDAQAADLAQVVLYAMEYSGLGELGQQAMWALNPQLHEMLPAELQQASVLPLIGMSGPGDRKGESMPMRIHLVHTESGPVLRAEVLIPSQVVDDQGKTHPGTPSFFGVRSSLDIPLEDLDHGPPTVTNWHSEMTPFYSSPQAVFAHECPWSGPPNLDILFPQQEQSV